MISASRPVVSIGASARGDDGVGDAARGPLLAQLIKHVREFPFRQRVHQIGRAGALFSHPHVQWPVGAEGKPARRVVDLKGGHAEVEHDAVECRDAGLVQQRHHVAELAVQQVQPAGEACHQAGAALDCLGVAIDRPKRAVRLLQNGAGVAAAAESAVEINARRRAARGSRCTSSSMTGIWPRHVGTDVRTVNRRT